MTDADNTTNLNDQLAAHRATLAHYLRQRAQLGSAHEPPGVAHGIAEARAGIAHCKATLQDWGVAVKNLPDDEEPAIQERPISTKSLFDPNTVLLADATIDLIASHLYEWKIVHSTVQGLLLSAVPFEKAIHLAERQLTADNIYFIEEMWCSQCRWRAEKILFAFNGLRFINHGTIDDLYTTIGSRIVDHSIRNLQPDNKEILVVLKRHLDVLMGSLRDVMVVTDLNITHIAESLKSKSPRKQV